MSLAPDQLSSDEEFELPETAVGSGIAPDDLVVEDGRVLEDGRAYCPNEGCTWWVPVGREHLADRHVCPAEEGVYDIPDDLVDASDLSSTEYLSLFVEDGVWTQDAANDLIEDLKPRPRSERIRLLFGWELFDFQRAMADDPCPDVSVNCGRQIGKTETGGAIGADAALFSAIESGHDVMFAGDVKDTAVEMFRRCTQHFERCPLSLEQIGVAKDNETSWEFANSTRILSGTLKDGGDNERGVLPKVIVVDEGALIKRSAFQDVIEPMFATHGDDHELFVVSTPRGEAGYHYDANTPDNEPDYFSPHSVPTSANPLVDDDFLLKKRASTDSISWRQEWLGEFVSEGNAYIPTSIYRPCQHDLPTAPGEFNSVRVGDHPRPGVEYYGGCDVAGEGRDRTVYIIMTGDGTAVHIENEETSKTPAVLGRIGALHAEFDTVAFGVDKNSIGEGVVQFADVDRSLSNVVEGIPFSTPQKSAMYKALKKAFEGEELTLPKHGRLERETTKMRYEYTANRHVRVHHPENGHDDHPDALALANWVRNNRSKKTTRRRRGTSPSKGSIR
ncbi:hypothetical protein C5C07_15460 [Haloferax sp. Atlit-4N]|uniref:terminase large subunit domain-containing protein n=1 Tax=Haloferax sp. Atlit-4N TaxID=2077206 RepID=UPI000E288A07|nr:terminase family protein [Haloferax sp. Atlit-4N]RDZ53131.1 hypothetical protein C5C07_15460 [Haloferax sp. Atlit-4N]